MKQTLAVAAALLLLAGCSSTPAAVITSTQSATPTPTTSDEPTEEPIESTFSDADLGDLLGTEDFKVGIKVLEKTCFGSAGCNITFRIKPEFVGPLGLPSSGETEVTYKIKGGEQSQSNYFTVDADGTAHFDSKEFISTSSSKKKLTAVVTGVEWSE